MSATLDAAAFAHYFGGTKIVYIQVRPLCCHTVLYMLVVTALLQPSGKTTTAEFLCVCVAYVFHGSLPCILCLYHSWFQIHQTCEQGAMLWQVPIASPLLNIADGCLHACQEPTDSTLTLCS